MRVALLVVAFMATVALVSAASASLTLTGTYYTDNACSLPSGGYPVTLTTSASTSSGGTFTLPCVAVGTGTGTSSTVLTGSCTTSAESSGGVTVGNEWVVQIYTGATCPASGSTATGPQGGTISASADDTSSTLKYPDSQVVTGFATGTTGCFVASGCSYSGASTLVAPTFLLVALAFVARKLSL